MTTDIQIPDTLTQYSAIVKWMVKIFEGCDDLNVTKTVLDQLNYLLQLYRHSEDPTNKFITDLISLDQIWNIRIIALSNTEYPDYWNPMIETFLEFKLRNEDKTIKVLNSSAPIIESDQLLDFLFKLKEINTEAGN